MDLTIQNEKKFKLSKKGKKRRHLRNLMSQHSTPWVTLRAGKQLGLQTHQQTPKFPGIWAKPRSSCRHTQTCTPRQRTPSQRWEKKKGKKNQQQKTGRFQQIVFLPAYFQEEFCSACLIIFCAAVVVARAKRGELFPDSALCPERGSPRSAPGRSRSPGTAPAPAGRATALGPRTPRGADRGGRSGLSPGTTRGTHGPKGHNETAAPAGRGGRGQERVKGEERGGGAGPAATEEGRRRRISMENEEFGGADPRLGRERK